MRHLPAVLLLFAVAGCAPSRRADIAPAGTGDVSETRIVATYRSRKAPASIAQCLEDKLGDLGSPLEWPTGGGRAVSFSMRGKTLALFEIAPDGTTTFRDTADRPDFRTKAETCF